MANIYHRQKSCLLTSLVAPKLLARQDGAQGPERNAQSLELNKHKESDKLSCSCFTKEFTGMSRTTQIILDETNQCWYLWCTAYSLLMPCCGWKWYPCVAFVLCVVSAYYLLPILFRRVSKPRDSLMFLLGLLREVWMLSTDCASFPQTYL